MPPPTLTNLHAPIAINPSHIVDTPTTFRVSQHGKGLHSTQLTVSNEEGEVLFSVDGKYGSLDERKYFRDRDTEPIFELYHKPMGVTWYVELPNGTTIARLAPKFSVFKDCLDVSVEGNEDVVLQVRGQDIWKQRTNVYLGEENKVVMTVKRTDKLSTYLPGKKIEWDVSVGAGMDLSLASCIVVVMAANMYDSSMQKSSAK